MLAHKPSSAQRFTADRIDILESGGLSMSLPVQGEFRVKNGLVAEWVDRFSWTTAIAEIGRNLPGIIRYRLRS